MAIGPQNRAQQRPYAHTIEQVAIDAGLRAYMLRVYNYMASGLALTGIVAAAVANVPEIRDLFFGLRALPTGGTAWGPTMLGWVAIIAPILFPFLLYARIHKMSTSTAQMTFWAYAGLVGISIASILMVYTGASVARVFFITA